LLHAQEYCAQSPSLPALVVSVLGYESRLVLSIIKAMVSALAFLTLALQPAALSVELFANLFQQTLRTDFHSVTHG
jgi:hypothetical protein